MNHQNPRPQADRPDVLDQRLREDADSFNYPPTPNVAAHTPWRALSESRLTVPRRLLWAIVIVVAVLFGLLTVPQVRAAIFEILHIGGITIIPTTVTPQPTPTSDNSLYPLPTPLSSVLDLAGATTLEKAQTALNVPIRLPSYPASLGQPDKVFVQQFTGPVVILVWLDTAHPEQAWLSLYILDPHAAADKFSPQIIQQTTVNGQPALWTRGAHFFQFVDGQGGHYDFARLVNGNVLIWTEGTLTYRLETDLPLEEAVKIAESLR